MKVNIETGQNKVILQLNGSFIFTDYSAFTDATHYVLDIPGTEEIHLDFNNVDYLDSAALGMLLLFCEKARQRKIHLCNCKGLVKAVLNTTICAQTSCVRFQEAPVLLHAPA